MPLLQLLDGHRLPEAGRLGNFDDDTLPVPADAYPLLVAQSGLHRQRQLHTSDFG
jgi:hypothetical protein